MSPNQYPDGKFELSEVSTGQYLSPEKLAPTLYDMQDLIAHLTRRSDEELAEMSDSRIYFPERATRFGSRLASSILKDMARRGETPQDIELATKLIADGHRLLERFKQGKSTSASLHAERTINMGTPAELSESFSVNPADFAAYLEQIFVIHNVASRLGTQRMGVEHIRASTEDYAQTILELIKSLVAQSGGLILDSEMSTEFSRLGHYYDEAIRP